MSPLRRRSGSSWLTWKLTSWSAATPRQAQRAGAPGGRAPLPAPARRGQRADQRGGQPGAKVAKARRLPSTWQAGGAGCPAGGDQRGCCSCTPRSPAAAAASDHLVPAVRVARDRGASPTRPIGWSAWKAAMLSGMPGCVAPMNRPSPRRMPAAQISAPIAELPPHAGLDTERFREWPLGLVR
jgi:hypothetical protein